MTDKVFIDSLEVGRPNTLQGGWSSGISSREPENSPCCHLNTELAPRTKGHYSFATKVKQTTSTDKI